MLLPGQQACRVGQLAETTKGRLEILVAERIQPEKINLVGGLRGAYMDFCKLPENGKTLYDALLGKLSEDGPK